MARPTKQQHEQRTALLRARVTRAEKIHACERAKAAGFDISDIIRRACLDEEIAPSANTLKVNAAVISELNRIGNNINQIARNINSGRRERLDLDVTIAELRGVLEKVVNSDGA